MPHSSDGIEPVLIRPLAPLHQSDGDTQALYQLQGDLTDAGPNTLNLTEQGTVTYTRADQAAISGATHCRDWIGEGLDGHTSNYGDRASNDTELTIGGELTIMCMVYPTALPAQSVVCAMSANGVTAAEDYQYMLYITSGGKLAYFAETSDVSQLYISTGASVSLNQWQHLTITRDSGGDVELYVDGVSVGSATRTSPGAGGNTRLSVGSDHVTGDNFGGQIASLIIKNVQMNSTQVGDEATRMLAGWT